MAAAFSLVGCGLPRRDAPASPPPSPRASLDESAEFRAMIEGTPARSDPAPAEDASQEIPDETPGKTARQTEPLVYPSRSLPRASLDESTEFSEFLDAESQQRRPREVQPGRIRPSAFDVRGEIFRDWINPFEEY